MADSETPPEAPASWPPWWAPLTKNRTLARLPLGSVAFQEKRRVPGAGDVSWNRSMRGAALTAATWTPPTALDVADSDAASTTTMWPLRVPAGAAMSLLPWWLAPPICWSLPAWWAPSTKKRTRARLALASAARHSNRRVSGEGEVRAKLCIRGASATDTSRTPDTAVPESGSAVATTM